MNKFNLQEVIQKIIFNNVCKHNHLRTQAKQLDRIIDGLHSLDAGIHLTVKIQMWILLVFGLNAFSNFLKIWVCK